ncbi:MAG TPA: cytochrome o ubiquinol oxidase subunit IV [Chlamydiales bacterium]|nr:cytochrome o ubiquinol oxidase subunit IV [Chlamydiales bacterium]
MSEERSLKEIQKDWPQTLKLYLCGFVGSLILTGISFTFAALKVFSTPILIATLIFLALLQASVQLVFFMHMGKEAKPRWMTLVFYFMVMVVVIIALGTLWIMSDLNARVMPM